MSETVIKIENLSKQYRLGYIGAGTLRGDLQKWFSRIRGKDDPFMTIGSENNLKSAEGKYIWALRDINLEVKEGEVLGIIGKNGAGKSTLLKILSRVTGPTSGSLKIKGIISSLLEVGTGFHPELTGRENIYLNGAILGMKKAETRVKLDEIVEFSGIAKYLDTPVKRYSSGMHVRLAFAVAAHLDPDILVVDEVLAVGDAEFQQKAIGKMQDVSKNAGRTVLFVSHNMPSIENLCSRTIILNNGQITYEGDSNLAIKKYISNNQVEKSVSLQNSTSSKNNIILKDFNLFEENEPAEKIKSGNTLKIRIDFEINKICYGVGFRILIIDKDHRIVTVLNNAFSKKLVTIKNNGFIIYTIPKLPLPEGKYYLSLKIHTYDGTEVEVEYVKELLVFSGDYFSTGIVPRIKEGVFINHDFEKYEN